MLPGIPGLPWKDRVRGSVGLQSNICVVKGKKKKPSNKKQPKTHVQIIFICSITTIMMTGSDISLLLSAYNYNENFGFRTKWEEWRFRLPCRHLNIARLFDKTASSEVFHSSVTEETALACGELVVRGYQWIHWHRCILWEIQMKYLHPRWCKYKFKQMNKEESKTRHLKTLLSQQRCKVPARDKSETPNI